jgi:hypothetical protein
MIKKMMENRSSPIMPPLISYIVRSAPQPEPIFVPGFRGEAAFYPTVQDSKHQIHSTIYFYAVASPKPHCACRRSPHRYKSLAVP